MQESTLSPAVASTGPRLALFDPEAVRPTSDAKPEAKPARKRKKATPADKDLPLWQRADDGRWCRKIRGRVHYFGTDKEKALEKWANEKDDLFAGRTPRTRKVDGLLLGDLCEKFLNAKRARVQTGERSPETFNSYFHTCNLLIAQFGKFRRVDDLAADDFSNFRDSLSKTRGLVGIGNVVRLSRGVFKYALAQGLIEKPVRFGDMFDMPRRRDIRKARAGKPAKMFQAAEIKKMLAKADDVLKCMILLGINAGLGQSDIANLTQSAIDLKARWMTFPRVKTGTLRRIPLWPETVDAIRKAIQLRREPKSADDADLVFVSEQGNRVVRTTAGKGRRDGVSNAFRRLLVELKLDREGAGFYSLRHTFATISSGACDQVATNAVMGHIPPGDDVPGMYRESIADERLVKVTNFVRAWLFPAKRKPR